MQDFIYFLYMQKLLFKKGFGNGLRSLFWVEKYYFFAARSCSMMIFSASTATRTAAEVSSDIC